MSAQPKAIENSPAVKRKRDLFEEIKKAFTSQITKPVNEMLIESANGRGPND